MEKRIYDNNILVLNVTAEVLVSDDGIFSVNDYGIVTALIEHTEVNTHNRGVIHTLAHTALIGRYNHSLVGVNVDVGILA